MIYIPRQIVSSKVMIEEAVIDCLLQNPCPTNYQAKRLCSKFLKNIWERVPFYQSYMLIIWIFTRN